MATTAGAVAPIRPPAMQAAAAAVQESGAGIAAGRGEEGGSVRLGNIMEKILANVHRIDNKVLFALLVSLARGVDYAITHNEIPTVANLLPTLVKQVCMRKSDIGVLSAVTVLMNTIKVACRHGWFIDVEVQELNLLADQLRSCFSTEVHPTVEPTAAFLLVSQLMSRFYPQLTLGEIVVSMEAKAGYEILLSDFHISKSSPLSSKGRIRLLVAQKDNIESSSCIVNPTDVNFMINGKGVESRVCSLASIGPQLPSDVTSMLVYGTNLMQVIGQFNGGYIIILAYMSVKANSFFIARKEQLQEYVPPKAVDRPVADGDLIEGPSRISLHCPISFKRIRTPVKGHLCRHHQCFDYDNFVEMNTRRPSWRCPHCNQSIIFCDIRIDRNMSEVLSKVGEDVEDVLISADGTWKCSLKECADDDVEMKTPPSDRLGLEADLLPQNVSELSKAHAENDIVDLTIEDLDFCASDDLAGTRKYSHESLSDLENVLAGPVLSTSGTAAQDTVLNSDLYNEIWSNILVQTDSVANGSHGIKTTHSATTLADCRMREPSRLPQPLTYNTGANFAPIVSDGVSSALTRAASLTSAVPAVHTAESRERGNFANQLPSQQLQNRFGVPNFGTEGVRRLPNARFNAPGPPGAHQTSSAQHQGPNAPILNQRPLLPTSHGRTRSTEALPSPIISRVHTLPPFISSAMVGSVGTSMERPGLFQRSVVNPPAVSNNTPTQVVTPPAGSLGLSNTRITPVNPLQQKIDSLGKRTVPLPTSQNENWRNINRSQPPGLNVQPVNFSSPSTLVNQHPRPSTAPSPFSSIGVQQRHHGQRIGLTSELRPSSTRATTIPGTILSQGIAPVSGRGDAARSPSIERDRASSPAGEQTPTLMNPDQLPSDENWRPTKMMRGSIVGRSYSSAVSGLILEPSSAAAPSSSSSQARLMNSIASPRFPFISSITGDPQKNIQK